MRETLEVNFFQGGRESGEEGGGACLHGGRGEGVVSRTPCPPIEGTSHGPRGAPAGCAGCTSRGEDNVALEDLSPGGLGRAPSPPFFSPLFPLSPSLSDGDGGDQNFDERERNPCARCLSLTFLRASSSERHLQGPRSEPRSRREPALSSLPFGQALRPRANSSFFFSSRAPPLAFHTRCTRSSAIARSSVV